MRTNFLLLMMAAGLVVACEQQQDLGNNGGSSGTGPGADAGVSGGGNGGEPNAEAGLGGSGGVGPDAGVSGGGSGGSAGGPDAGVSGGGSGGIGGTSGGGGTGPDAGTAGGGGTGPDAGTAGVGGSGGGPAIVCMGEQVRGIAVDDTFLYCTRSDGVVAMGKTGSLLDPNTPSVNYVVIEAQAMGVALDSANVYLSRHQVLYGPTYYGVINASPKANAGMWSFKEMYVGNYENPYDPHPFHSACGIVADADALYWSSDHGIIKGAKSIPDGGAPYSNDYTVLAQEFLCSSTWESPNAIAQDDASVYWVQDTKVMKVLKAGGASAQVASASSPLVSLHVFGGQVFYTEAGAGASDGNVWRAPVNGGSATLVASGQARPYGIAADGVYVYWTNNGSCGAEDGALMRSAVAGGAAEVVQPGQKCPKALVIDQTSVFWAANSPAQPQYDFVYRIAK
ncbi:MAG: hypothetical protein HY898_23940 [Deltaproteobacteria bacterium]|nr:hypothetical protein [Deltaproteobacteria bacterium]